ALLLILGASTPRAGTITIFGPQTLARTTGAPDTFDFTFPVTNPALPYTLSIDNDGLASAVVTLNGLQVVAPRDFNPGVRLIQKTVALHSTNALHVELRSKAGSTLTLRILGTDNDRPTITAAVQPAPNAAEWNRSDVQVTFTCADAGSGIASCTPPQRVTAEGRQVITGTAVDNAGNTATASVTLNIDKTAPTIAASMQPPANDSGWVNQNATVTFACADDRSGIASCPPQTVVSSDGGNQVASGSALDAAGNSATTGLRVNVDKTPPS